MHPATLGQNRNLPCVPRRATLSPLPRHARDLPANQDLRDLEQAMEAFARTQEDEGDE
jgi:hypothetical protein